MSQNLYAKDATVWCAPVALVSGWWSGIFLESCVENVRVKVGDGECRWTSTFLMR